MKNGSSETTEAGHPLPADVIPMNRSTARRRLDRVTPSDHTGRWAHPSLLPPTETKLVLVS